MDFARRSEHSVAAASGYHAGMLQALSALIFRPRKPCEDRQADSEQYKNARSSRNAVTQPRTNESSTSTPEQIKVLATMSGDSISHADIALRIPKHPGTTLRTIVQNDCQWKLQQVQDAGNNLMTALQLLTPPPPSTKFEFKSAEEVTQLMTTVMGCLQRGRASLIIPKKRTIDEILGSRNMKSLQPPLPQDLGASFYVQSHKLIFAVYYVHKDSHGQPKFDVFQAETSVPWLSEVLVLFTIALQLCQQLKDKVGVFYQYREFHIP
ncbi:rogdi atypical leucine zipper isoform X2 [Rhipicephalus microplus]|uniref:rogdi atypical leucine zipper isoform X2 n=1 Tax=Rhipicephalus microplus TaxID=6941 RepID=UPI003F6D34A9